MFSKALVNFSLSSIKQFSTQAEKVIDEEMQAVWKPLSVQFEKVSKLVWQGRWFGTIEI